MKNVDSTRVHFILLLIISLILNLPGFSQKKPDTSLPAGTIKLVYSYPSDRAIKYLNSTKIVQDMDINGQSMLVNVSTYLECMVKQSGKQGGNLKMEIKIDTMATSIDSPQGSSGGTVNELKDKVFNIVISPSGKTTDISEAAKLMYHGAGGEQTDASETFQNYFPALPEAPVKAGDTWITRDTIKGKSLSTSRWMPVESNNKFEGIEKYNGIDCARITATLSGLMKMTNQSQGMDIAVSGKYTGTMILLFAVNEGYFVRESTTTKMTGTIDITSENMSFPVVMDITSTNEMVK